jgi:hypothetical protein
MIGNKDITIIPSSMENDEKKTVQVFEGVMDF